VEEEADESLYWMELLIDGGIVPKGKMEDLMHEGNEILAMVVKSIRTAKANLQTGNGKSRNALKEETNEYVVEWLINDEE
jgi:hypothetical protein